jgi:cytoskeleton protein RodZ
MTQNAKQSDGGNRLTALGSMLKDAREAQAYSVAEVAERLFLSSNQVTAIEQARYDLLPADVFVRGYLRAYAKLLNLDADAVLKQYQPPAAPKVEPQPEQVDEEQTPVRQLFERLPELPPTPVLGALAALVILALAGIVYFATSPDSPPAEPAPAIEQSAPAMDQLQRQDNTLLTDDAFEQQASSDPQLEMQFTDDCWVEVRDASRKILLADMRRAGDTEIVEGEPPYRVVLGQSEAVALRFQGRFIPITPDAGKQSAQIVIGG